MTYDSILVFSKTWGALYLLAVFVIAVIWTYWPSRKKEMEEAANRPFEEGDKPCR